MTENKRFTLKYINEQHISANIYDDKTFIGSIGIGEELIVELLNSFNDENDVLKQQLKTKYIVNKQYEELQRLKQENEQLKKALVELKEIGDYQEGRIKELNDENEQLDSELEKVVEVCRKYGIYKDELQYVLADYDKMLNENGERAIRYKYCVNSR